MRTMMLRRKHVRFDQAKLEKRNKGPQAVTDKQAVDRPLTVLESETGVDAILRRAGGKTRLKKVFR